jgi:hypothetical protein
MVQKGNPNKKTVSAGMLLLLLSIILMPNPSVARVISKSDVQAAVQTWVREITADAKPDAVIERMEPFRVEGETVAYIAHIEGGGFCLCGQDDLVLPVYLYSPEGTFDRDNPGYRYFLFEIAARTKSLMEASEKGNERYQNYADTFRIRSQMWQDLIAGFTPPPRIPWHKPPPLLRLTQWN